MSGFRLASSPPAAAHARAISPAPQAGQAQASRRGLVPEAIAQFPSAAQRTPGNDRMPETGTGLSGSRVSQGLGERGQVYDLPGRDTWVIEQ